MMVSELVKRYMSRILKLIVFCLFIFTSVNAQQTESYFFVTGKVKVEQGLVDGTTIQIFRNGGLLNSVTINRTGNFRIRVDLNHVYRFVFVKDDFYSKTIEFDTHVPPDVCDQNCVFPPYQLALLLYKKVPGVTETSSEVGRISYNPKVDNFDAELLREAQDGIDGLDKVVAELRSKSQKHESQKSDDKKEKYRIAIADADRLYQNGEYEKAMHRYRDAVMIFPQIQYPRNRVNQLYAMLLAQEVQGALGEVTEANFLKYLNYGDAKFKEKEFTMAKVCYERAQQIRPDDMTVKNKLYETNKQIKDLNDLALKEVDHFQTVYQARTAKYNELIKNADALFVKEDFAVAKDYYAQAASQIGENSYALLMISKIDELISDDEAALKLAREREEAEKERLRLARNQAYNDAIAEADRLLGQRLYRDAIENYELALTIKSYELYPQQQINEIKKILADLQLRGEEYNGLIRTADQLFYDKEYPDARIQYVKAHDLIPKERYAQQKINEIDRLLTASKIEEELMTKYQAFIKNADDLFNEKKYKEAIDEYLQASKVLPNENYPKDQVRKIRGILSREDDEQKRLLAQQNKYDQYILNADKAFNLQSYQIARSLYQEALQVIPGQEYPLNQIDKIDRILREKEKQASNAKSKLEQIDFSNLGNVSAQDRDEAYNEAMALGESFIKSEEWGLARFYFRRALALKPNDSPATTKLNFVDGKILGDNANEEKYNEMIKKADEAFRTGDFGVAKFYYAKAKEAKPTDSYVTERLAVVTKMAENTAARNMDRDYDSAMKKASDAMTVNNYSVARFFYRKALSLKSDDALAKKKLEEVEALINKK